MLLHMQTTFLPATAGPRPVGMARAARRNAVVLRSTTNSRIDAGAAQQQLRPLRVFAPNDDTGEQLEAEVLARPGSRVITISLKKPLGLVLAESGGRFVVESVIAGGHAASTGVAVGDVLLATGARAQVGGGKDARLVLLPTAGEKFSTVAAAIRSNTCSQCRVHLVFEKPANVE